MKNGKTHFLIGLITVAAMEVFGGVAPVPEMEYARLVERELAGELSAALTDYRALLSTLPAGNLVLTERLLYRIGVCEKRLGRPEQARQAWRKLVESCPPEDPQVEVARAALKNLERELDRVVMKGEVRVQGSGFRVQELGGKSLNPDSLALPPEPRTLTPSPPCFVLAGEWGSEPPALCDTNGAFALERRVAGRLKDGRRYGYVFAEHPVNPWVGGGVWVDGGVTNIIPVRGGAPAFSGRVVDGRGKAVRDALIRVMGYAEVGGEEVPLPFDNLLPPSFSGTNGEFLVTGLIPGCRYVFTAEKNGWRLSAAASPPPLKGEGEGVLTPLSSIILQTLGDISLRGRVVDESGKGIQAQVAAWTDSPDEHELARVNADEDGRFLFRDLRENFVSLRVESEGYSPRLLPGIKPMGQEIDVVMRGGGGRKEGVQYSEVRIQNPEVRIQNPESEYRTLNTEHFLSSLEWVRGNPDSGEGVREEDLRGHVVVFHFGSAYVESLLRSKYPGEPGVMSQMMAAYGARGLVCIWVLPEGEKQGDAARMALELYPDLPVGVRREKSVFSVQYSEGEKKNPESRIQNPEDGKKREPRGLLSENRTLNTEHSFRTPETGNLVLGRDGRFRSFCSDQQLFKAVKAAIGASTK